MIDLGNPLSGDARCTAGRTSPRDAGSLFRRPPMECPQGEPEEAGEPDEGRERDYRQLKGRPTEGAEARPDRRRGRERDELLVDRGRIPQPRDLEEPELGLEVVRKENQGEDGGDHRVQDVEREKDKEAEQNRSAARLRKRGEDELERNVEGDQEEFEPKERDGEARRRRLAGSRDRKSTRLNSTH